MFFKFNTTLRTITVCKLQIGHLHDIQSPRNKDILGIEYEIIMQ